MPNVRVNGVSLYYEEHGAGEPILCIHGTGSSTVLWRDAAESWRRTGARSCTTAAGSRAASARSRS